MRVFRATYKDKNGKKRRSGAWYVEIRIDGQKRRFPGFTDKRATEELGRRVERLAAIRASGGVIGADTQTWIENLPARTRDYMLKTGLLDAAADAAARPLMAHVDGFKEYLIHEQHDTEAHTATTVSRIKKVLTGCDAAFVSDLTTAAVAAWIGKQKLNAGGRNHYVAAIKSFSRWLSDQTGHADPLAGLQRYMGNPAFERRSLTEAELSRLLGAAESGPTWRKITGGVRRLIYLTAARTGLRAAELAALTPSDLRLDGVRPVLIVHCEDTKNDKETFQPITVELASLLATHAGRLPAKSPLFAEFANRGRYRQASKMIHADMERAKIKVEIPQSRADFHCLRIPTSRTSYALASPWEWSRSWPGMPRPR